MKKSDVVEGGQYKLTSTKANSNITYKDNAFSGWISAVRSGSYYNPTYTWPNNVRISKKDILVCEKKESSQVYYNVYRPDGTNYSLAIKHHGCVRPASTEEINALHVNRDDSPEVRKRQTEIIKSQINTISKQINTHEQAVSNLQSQLKKLNAKYHLLTSFKSDKEAVASVIASMKDASPEEIVEKLSFTGIDIKI